MASMYSKLSNRVRRGKRRLFLALRNRLTKKLPGPATVSDNVRFFANPGPLFEHADPVSRTTNSMASTSSTVSDTPILSTKSTLSSAPRVSTESIISMSVPTVKAVAFYLPQFHTFEENDQWWGAGFTEWRNVARGAPRFSGHYQPRVPRDLGYYDLSESATIRQQSELANRNGIDAFCFYYYWFNGKRLMDKPLDLFAGDSAIDQEFCIMWANENWTRTWDGFDNDVLIQQDYQEQDEADFLKDTARYMQHERYMKINGRPLFILYRPGLLPDSKETLDRWRKKWCALLGIEPLIFMVQGFGAESPAEYGLDGAIEFPPHKLCADLRNINHKVRVLDKQFKGLVHDYEDVIDRSLNEDAPDYPLIKTVVPHWDNDARREGRGTTLQGSTPKSYMRWLKGAVAYAKKNPVFDAPVVFINAWNEWAEGAYLEPDVHYGHAYLNATRRAIQGVGIDHEQERILLVGHDAYKHGAQMLLLNIARIYAQQFGMQVSILLKEGGPLLDDYRAIAPVYLLADVKQTGFKQFVLEHEITTAICNTTVTGDLLPSLCKHGVRCVSLVHEMPQLIEQYGLKKHVKEISTHASHIVFAAQTVKAGFNRYCDKVLAPQHIRPQGSYVSVSKSASARLNLRQTLQIDVNHRVVLGSGYADLRKGFDLFMQHARQMTKANPKLHFVWIGAIEAELKAWVVSEKDLVNKQIHLPGFVQNVSEYYSVADCLFLPSREDPYPTVVLEAMEIGLPVVLFKGATGFDQLMSEHGYLVDIDDEQAIRDALIKSVNESDIAKNPKALDREQHVKKYSRFDDYCLELHSLLHPGMQALKRAAVRKPSSQPASSGKSAVGRKAA